MNRSGKLWVGTVWRTFHAIARRLDQDISVYKQLYKIYINIYIHKRQMNIYTYTYTAIKYTHTYIANAEPPIEKA